MTDEQLVAELHDVAVESAQAHRRRDEIVVELRQRGWTYHRIAAEDGRAYSVVRYVCVRDLDSIGQSVV